MSLLINNSSAVWFRFVSLLIYSQTWHLNLLPCHLSTSSLASSRVWNSSCQWKSRRQSVQVRNYKQKHSSGSVCEKQTRTNPASWHDPLQLAAVIRGLASVNVDTAWRGTFSFKASKCRIKILSFSEVKRQIMMSSGELHCDYWNLFSKKWWLIS